MSLLLRALAAAARTAQSIDAGQEKMLLAASRFCDLKARQIMTPRTMVAYLRVDQSVDQVLDTVQHSPYTRLPLCEEDIDHVIGATLGIVTLEDVLEEIVGRIEDEFDRPHGPDVVPEEGGFRVNGQVPLHELQDWIQLPEKMVTEVDTVGGLVAKALGHIPEIGDTIVCSRYQFRVVSADRRRVKEVVVTEVPRDGDGQ